MKRTKLAASDKEIVDYIKEYGALAIGRNDRTSHKTLMALVKRQILVVTYKTPDLTMFDLAS